MTEQTNTQTIQNAYAAFGRNDIDAIIDLLAENVDWQFFGSDELPMAGNRKGKPEVRRFFKEVGESWNFEKFEPRQFIASGDNVVALGAYGGTAKNTGRKFNSEFAHVFTLQGGKIAKFREYSDTANLIGAYSASLSRA